MSKSTGFLTAALSAVAFTITADPAAQAPAPAWPQWRGPFATGEAPTGDPPTRWSETEHVRWKAAIPGSGASTPIIWGDTIYLQTAVSTGELKFENRNLTNDR